jgi:diaminopimelate decarboxylase
MMPTTTAADSVSSRTALPFDALQVARRFGTPTWVYDHATLTKRIGELVRPSLVIRYAQKANNNLAILSVMRKHGVVVDAVTAGEIARALHVGYAGKDIVYTADLFDDDALDAIRKHGCPVNAGSPDMIDQIAEANLQHIPVTLRLNPGFGHGHSQKVNTGGPFSKHGIWHEQLPDVVARAKKQGVTLHGLHMHIGSGADFEHLAQVCDAMVAAAQIFVNAGGTTLDTISAGGGLPIPYRKSDEHYQRIDLERYIALWEDARQRVSTIVGRDVTLEIEPGRYLVAESGYLVTKVRSVKVQGHGSDANDVILIDAGFNDLIRPAMYGAYHHISIVPASGRAATAQRDYIVAGPLCESCDVFTQGDGGDVQTRRLPEAKPGDVLVLHDTGAYGMAMSSNYNSRRIAAEVLHHSGKLDVIRERQPVESLYQFERIPTVQ